MPSEKLETFSRENPQLAQLVRALEEYLRWQKERGVKEIVPRVAAAKLAVSEADTLGLLALFEDAGLVKHRYDVICARSDGSIESFDSLDEIPDELYCRFCGDQHCSDDMRIELVFEIANGQAADAAA
jgi:hypothetical protein